MLKLTCSRRLVRLSTFLLLVLWVRLRAGVVLRGGGGTGAWEGPASGPWVDGTTDAGGAGAGGCKYRGQQ